MISLDGQVHVDLITRLNLNATYIIILVPPLAQGAVSNIFVQEMGKL